MKRGRFRMFSYLTFIVLILLSSCSLEKNRKLLSVFFDGVPDQKTSNSFERRKGQISTTSSKRPVIQTITSVHPDYKSRKCSKCHTRDFSNQLVTSRKKICFTCHKEKKFQGEYVHGPVAVRACNTCHDPHQSKNRKLLVAEGKNLCFSCHKIPITGDPLPCKGDSCLECHEPHVADNKHFLKNSKKNLVITGSQIDLSGSENEQ